MATKNVVVLTYWSFKDALIQTYTLPYVRMIAEYIPKGSKVYLYTLEKPHLKLVPEEKDKFSQSLAKQGIIWVRLRYLPFGLMAILYWTLMILKLTLTIFSHRISVIHCWCTPAGAIGYILSVLTGRKLIIDSYEPHAETMVENGTWEQNSFAYKLLFRLEILQTRRASYLVAATTQMRAYAQEKYQVDVLNYYVKPACVDLELFSKKNLKNQELVKKLGLKDKIAAVYAGKFGGIYLEREVFDFLKIAHEYWGKKFRVILLTAHTNQEIRKLCKNSDLDYNIIIQKFVPHREVPDYLGLADFALTPVKPIPTKKYCTPIKDGEYWALGLPIVISPNISDDSAIILENGIGSVLKSFEPDSYRKSVQEIEKILGEMSREALFDKIRNIAITHRSFDIAKKIYSDIYQ